MTRMIIIIYDNNIIIKILIIILIIMIMDSIQFACSHLQSCGKQQPTAAGRRQQFYWIYRLLYCPQPPSWLPFEPTLQGLGSVIQ